MLEVLSHPSPSFNLDNSHVHHVSNHHYHLVLTYSEFINDSFVWEFIDDGYEVDISIRCVFSTKLSSMEKVNHIISGTSSKYVIHICGIQIPA